MQRDRTAESGVDYTGRLDPFKVRAQRAAESTNHNIERFDFGVVAASRGESCFLMRMPDGGLLAHVEETLGTENLVADAMAVLSGGCFYYSIGISGAAVILNDMATSGAQPCPLPCTWQWAGTNGWPTIGERKPSSTGGEPRVWKPAASGAAGKRLPCAISW